MTSSKKIKSYWDEQAKTHGKNLAATMPDYYLKKLEIENIKSCLDDDRYIVDIGCGNGYSLFEIAEKLPNSVFLGLDYSEEMIKQANKTLDEDFAHLKDRVKFEVSDITNLSLKKKADIIITNRCLINLYSEKDQVKAISNISKSLTAGGKYVMCEDFKDSLDNLNKLRQKMSLEPITTRWHNLYLNTQKIVESTSKWLNLQKEIRFSSLYYLNSRVIYAKMCQDNSETPDYLHPINEATYKLSSSVEVGDIGPLKLLVWQK